MQDKVQIHYFTESHGEDLGDTGTASFQSLSLGVSTTHNISEQVPAMQEMRPSYQIKMTKEKSIKHMKEIRRGREESL